MQQDFNIPQIINGRYYYKSKIDQGLNCSVCKYQDIVTQKFLALKFFNQHYSSSYLFLNEQVKGVPQIFDYGIWKEQNFIILQYLGTNLQKYISNVQINKLYFTVKICIQMLQILRKFHDKYFIQFLIALRGVVYGNINPSHIMFENSKSEQFDDLYLINFTKSIKVTNQNKQVSQQNSISFNQNFIPLSAHEGIRQNINDDLESLLYVLVYLYKGKLPWIDQKANIFQIKKQTPPTDLCSGMPKQFLNLIQLIKKNEPILQSDYEILIDQFMEIDKQLSFERVPQLKLKIPQEEEDSIQSLNLELLDKNPTFKNLENNDNPSTQSIRNSKFFTQCFNDSNSQIMKKLIKKKLFLSTQIDQEEHEKTIIFLKEINSINNDSSEEQKTNTKNNKLQINFLNYQEINQKKFKFISDLKDYKKILYKFS